MFLKFLTLSMLSLPNTLHLEELSPTDWAQSTYGDQIEFDIRRNGKKVGEHIVTFEEQESVTSVESSTDLRVKFLFFTAYRFEYLSREEWAHSNLLSVESTTKDGGKKSSLSKEFGETEKLYSTNHWNPDVLNQNRVYNTITGKTNNIEILIGDWEMVPTGTGQRKALRHDYTGDLRDVSSWYDEQGRWVALRFIARDGSIISYECRRCGT